MEIRNLGASGLKISAIAYGNWITHASQVEEDAAVACVHARPLTPESRLSTPRTCTRRRKPRACWGGARGPAARRPGDLHQGLLADRPRSHNDRGLSRKHIRESLEGSLRRLGTDYVDLYQAHRYDHETPLEETMRAFNDLVRSGKVLYIGVSEWRAEQIPAAAELARRCYDPIISSQPQYSMLWRVIEAEVSPRAETTGSARSSGRRSPRAC